MIEKRYINREISWLDFNARVLQEAADTHVPLLERLRFLGIFSNNLDEFFQVRYATVKRIAQSEKTGKKVFGGITATELLNEITQKVIVQQNTSLTILKDIEEALKQENIFFINENQVLEEQKEFLRDYFIQKVSPALVTMILSEKQAQDFTDNTAFLMIKLFLKEKMTYQYALIEIPKELDRFVVLPAINEKQYIMLLDDLIRFHFDLIFNFFNYTSIEAHMIKITRDAELDLEEDASKSYIKKIAESVKERIVADPVRLVYDNHIAQDTLDFIMKKLGIDSTNSLIPGGRYHHRRDYMDFPNLGRKALWYSRFEPLPIPGFSLEKSILRAIDKRDYLIYTPYHSFSYLVKFLREAALDPEVKTIKITIYRLSKLSNVVSSLINAAKNGKTVLVQIELQARFDEANNINHAERLKAAGIQLIFGVAGLKVHSKMCVIEKVVHGKKKRYGFISTGNLNETTARIYTDYTLFTADQKLLQEVNRVFSFLQVNYQQKKFKHLIVSPHYMHKRLFDLIDEEIKNAKNNLPSGIQLKINAITNYKMVDKLYEASAAGVPIKMIVRGVCCLIPGVQGMSENSQVISVVDKFLEHPRVYIFENGGTKKVFLSSADLMTRNIDNRVEVGTPVFDKNLQKQIIDVFNITWSDTTKARIINKTPQNNLPETSATPIRSQWAIYDYYKNYI